MEESHMRRNELVAPFQRNSELASPKESMKSVDREMDAYTEADYDKMEVDKTLDFKELAKEYRKREEFDEIDPKIHHWNWLGYPVYERTLTPPADSLAFLQTTPKAPMRTKRYRIRAIMNNAMELIDPVVVKLEKATKGFCLCTDQSLYKHARAGLGTIFPTWSLDERLGRQR